MKDCYSHLVRLLRKQINLKDILLNRYFKTVLIYVCLILTKTVICQPVVQLLSTNGTFTVPTGVTSLKVECWGGGGGGGWTNNSGQSSGGGGGGAYAKSNLIVSPGQTFAYVVGIGGNGGNASSVVKDGGDTYFGSPSTVMAKGGLGVANNSTPGASGGQASASVGNVITRNGGNGGNGTGSGSCHASGGGGGGAGSDASGGNGANGAVGSGLCLNGGTGGVGGTGGSQLGGNGGTGASAGGNGGSGNAYSAGGGGAKTAWLLGSSQNGGFGSGGIIRVTYCIPPSVNAGNDVTINCSGSTTLNGSASVPSGNQTLYSANSFSDFANFITNDGNRWVISATAFAGGVADEMLFRYFSGSDPTVISSWVMSSPVDATYYTTINLSFKHFVDHFTGTYNLKLQTSTDQANWTDRWTLSPTADVAANTVNVNLNVIAGQIFYFRFLFDGNVWNIDNWYIDDILLNGNVSIPVTYSWSPSTGLSNPNIANPVASPASTTTYTLTAIAGGCSSSDQVTVSVGGGGIPSITCPSNITMNAAFNNCSAVVTYTPPVGTDECGTPSTSQTAGLSSGNNFPVGVTTNTFTVTSGVQTANCSFTVTINDLEPPTIVCPPPVSVNNSPGNCGAVVNFSTPVGNDNCSGASTLLTSGLASGSLFPVGVTNNVFTVTAANGQNANCSFTVTVNYTANPSINCPSPLIVNNNIGICGAIVNYTTPVGSDNCASTSTLQTNGYASGATFPLGTTTNVFVVTAATGQTANCLFTVTVNYNEPPTIICPAPIVVNNSPGICGAAVSFDSPIGTDNCTGSTTIQTTGLPSGFIFPVGTTTNTFNVSAASGQSASCSFTVTVNNSGGMTGNLVESDSGSGTPVFYHVYVLTHSGGTAPINYNWNTTGWVQHTFTGTNEITIVYGSGSSWSVTISDSSSGGPCGANVMTFNSPDPSGNAGDLNIASFNITSDSGLNTGAISLIVEGGNPCGGNSYQYVWGFPMAWIPPGNTNISTISNLPAGWYTVTVSDCGSDGLPGTVDDNSVIGWYWVPKQIRGRGKSALESVNANLIEVYPNPFQDQTNVSFSVPITTLVKISVYDLSGKTVAVLFDGTAPKNEPLEMSFNSQNLPSGVYICHINVPELNISQKVKLITLK